MARSEDSPAFIHHSVPNRSLGPRGRRWCLAAIATTTFAVASAAAAFGAWPVMPFAGIEIALVALAFRVLAAHDRDFERLVIDAAEIRVEARDAARETRFVANRAWARMVLQERGASCAIALRYGGKTVPLGRMLSDEGRRRLAREIRGRLAVARN